LNKVRVLGVYDDLDIKFSFTSSNTGSIKYCYIFYEYEKIKISQEISPQCSISFDTSFFWVDCFNQ
jgi:hypothetical protein